MVVPANALQEILHEEMEHYFRMGVEEGMRIEAEKRRMEFARPLTMEEAADALGLSTSTVKGLRKKGDLESIDYGDSVRFERSEIERYKRIHTCLSRRC